MGNVHVFKQHYRSQYGDMTTALGGETTVADTITTPVFADGANYDLTRAVAQVSNVVSTHVVTLLMYEATATDGSGSQSLTHAGATDTYTSTQATDIDVLEAQTRGEDLSSGYRYIGAKLSTDDADGTEVGSVFLVQGRARYKQSSMPT